MLAGFQDGHDRLGLGAAAVIAGGHRGGVHAGGGVGVLHQRPGGQVAVAQLPGKSDPGAAVTPALSVTGVLV